MRTPVLFALLLLLPVACQLVVDEDELAWNGATDAGLEPDGAIPADAGNPPDAGDETDAGLAADAGEEGDAGELPDAGLGTDAGELPDAGACASDCGARFCEPLSGDCVDCLEDSHCAGALVCHAHGVPFVCGEPWLEVETGGDKLNAVWVAADGTAWAVGDQAAVRRCTSSGCSTVTVDNLGSGTPSWNAVAGDEQSVWMVGTSGAVARCNQTCALLSETGLTTTLSSVLVLPNDVWATSATGSIHQESTAWGVGYSAQKWLRAIDEVEGLVISAGGDGTVVRCAAGLGNCSKTALDDREYYYGAAGAGAHWWLAGTLNSAGVVRRSQDGGASWYGAIPHPTQFHAVAAALTPEPTAWVAGPAGIWRADAQGNLIREHTLLVGAFNGIAASSDGRYVWAVGATATGGLIYRR